MVHFLSMVLVNGEDKIVIMHSNKLVLKKLIFEFFYQKYAWYM
jgi:hypothetical protein